MTNKKKAPKPFFQPEYTRLNTQLIVEIDGPLLELVSNDDILKFVNARTEFQGLKFIGVECNKNGNLRFETNLATSNKGSELIQEITNSLTPLTIKASNIYPNSRWSKYVIHGLPSTIGNHNRVELSANIAT